MAVDQLVRSSASASTPFGGASWLLTQTHIYPSVQADYLDGLPARNRVI